MFAKVSETNDAQNELSKIVYFRQVSQVNDDHISELSIFFLISKIEIKLFTINWVSFLKISPHDSNISVEMKKKRTTTIVEQKMRAWEEKMYLTAFRRYKFTQNRPPRSLCSVISERLLATKSYFIPLKVSYTWNSTHHIFDQQPNDNCLIIV